MKKYQLILLIFPVLILLASCVKQRNCEDGISGTFKYLDEPIYVQPYCQFKEEKVTAILIVDDSEFHITGSIPNEYKSGDFIDVRACLKDTHEDDTKFGTCTGVYKLKCITKIEKED